MTRILLLGKDGQLGRALARELPALGDLVALGHAEADLTDGEQLISLVHGLAPEIIVNAAAYTNVDQAESQEDLAYSINAVAPGVLAREAARIGALILHYSTDYVFDGRARTPYREEAVPRPLNRYGQSKLAGEKAVQEAGGRHLIFRTSWLYSPTGSSFVARVVRWAMEKQTLEIVDDQWGSPTSCRSLANASAHALGMVLRTRESRLGLFHVVCRGAPSRFDLASAVIEQVDLTRTPVLERAYSDQFPLPARRPQFSALDPSHFEEVFEYRMPGWKGCLRGAFSSGSGPGAQDH